jgi:SHS2 domain-containing protein
MTDHSHCGSIPRWEHFSHVADMGVRGLGHTLAEAFEEAALALTAIVCDPQRVHPETPVQIRVSAPDEGLLLNEWLNVLIYEMATRRMLFARFRVHIEGTRLQTTARGETLARDRHRPAVEPKGATLTELKVYRAQDGTWIAQCVIDV